MMSIDGQAELGLARPPQRITVPLEMVWTRKTAAAAFCLACEVSQLEDKEIHIPLGIDKGYFSRIKSGDASLNSDKVADFCRIVGNTVYPEWIAYSVGCTLVMLKSGAERRADAAEQRADEAEKKLAWALEVLDARRK